MRKIAISILVVMLLMLFASVTHALPARLTIKVVGEDHAPVGGASVGIGFDEPSSEGRENTVNGVTANDGTFTAIQNTSSGHVGFTIKKNGYYESDGRYEFVKRASMGWEPPSEPLVVMLRRIEDPVPMYARKVKIEIPASGNDFGFDLVRSDWVDPYGQGTTIDVLIHLEKDYSGLDNFEYNVVVSFPGDFNGLYAVQEDITEGSAFKLPRKASTTGYASARSVFWRGLKRGAKASWRRDQHYVLRVRSEVKDGKFVRGMYGKIVSDISLFGTKRTSHVPGIQFSYYLNPDYTNNLEFDTKRNLFKNLSQAERVREP